MKGHKTTSAARRRRLFLAKQARKVSTQVARCSQCGQEAHAITVPELQAWLTGHYRDEHPQIAAFGGTAVLARRILVPKDGKNSRSEVPAGRGQVDPEAPGTSTD